MKYSFFKKWFLQRKMARSNDTCFEETKMALKSFDNKLKTRSCQWLFMIPDLM